MKKYIWSGLLILSGWTTAACQEKKIDSLKKILATVKDTTKVNTLIELSQCYSSFSNIGTLEEIENAKRLAREAVAEADRVGYEFGKGKGLYQLGTVLFLSFRYNGSFQMALDTMLVSIPYLKKQDHSIVLANCMKDVGNCFHMVGNIPKALHYLDTATRLSLVAGDTSSAIFSLATFGHCYFDIGDYQKAYEIGMKAIEFSQRTSDTFGKLYAITNIQNLYLAADLPDISREYLYRTFELFTPDQVRKDYSATSEILRWNFAIGGQAYMKSGLLDSALWIAKSIPFDTADFYSMNFYGKLYAYEHQYSKALPCYEKSYEQSVQLGHTIGIGQAAIELGTIYYHLNQLDEAKKYALVALEKSKAMHALMETQKAAGLLADIYNHMGAYEEGFKYTELYKSLIDSVAPEQFKRRLFLVRVQDELDKQKQQSILLTQENKIREQQLKEGAILRNMLVAGILVLLLIAFIIIRNNRQREIVNKLLKNEKEKVEQAFQRLKSAQAQLIQSEKMASLGELTAGIAHEIQNPLNFVNNFSELSTEMFNEMKEELATGNLQLATEIADDIKQNLEKINHHGKRADSIVKGMLQHSGTSTGIKEPTDINKLADEYLRLSYHGMRAKDKSFNAEITTDFDETIGSINVVPQDIGRVLLNLFNNAFYAVNEKAKLRASGCEPRVIVETKKINDRIEIIVRDNGNGIPQNIVDKIFQPFFTTKPTGQGTGLGLSLSYDIIKAHGGEIQVETEQGEESEFLIRLPINYSV